VTLRRVLVVLLALAALWLAVALIFVLGSGTSGG
jgi:hypothetical protein